jgi:ribosomal protein L11 methyltransferase
VSGSTWALHTTATLDEVNLHLASLGGGLLGITEEHGRATIYLAERLEDLPVEGTWEEITPRDWNAAWKAGFEPVRVGDVAVVAPWHDLETGAPLTLVVEPAQAFGTGHHETTTRCLAALQDIDLAGASVFDVGTGTGVLAMAAKALGAQRVLAVDIDPLAVSAAAANAAANGLDIDVARGSAGDAGSERFDVVVANIDTATVSMLASDLVAALAAGGRFIGSGVSNQRIEQAVDALTGAGMAVQAQPGVEWALLTGVR